VAILKNLLVLNQNDLSVCIDYIEKGVEILPVTPGCQQRNFVERHIQ
jgi:hypothetical protein